MQKVYLSVVIPAYKEVANIKSGVLDDVYKYLSNQKFNWEVLLVDDGSPDETGDLLEKYARDHPGVRAMRKPHRGKGGTVIAGMLAALGEVVLFTDMDQATPIDQIDKILPQFQNGYDGVIGVRSGREGAPPVRKIMAFGFRVLRALILRLPYTDTQCGFKAFKREAVKEIFGRMKVFSEKRTAKGAAVTAGFDLEILYIARKLGMKIAEVPVIWHHRETKRVNPVKDSIEGLQDLIKVRLNALTGKYNV